MLEVNDYYQYDKYEKMKMSINDLTPEKLEKGYLQEILIPQRSGGSVGDDQQTDSPISVQETASQTIFRKDPESKRPSSKERTPTVSKSFSPQETCWGLF